MTDKKKGAVPFESAPTSDSTSTNSTALDTSRPLFHPLTWRTEKPARPHSEYGRTTPEALAWMAITGLMMLAGWLWELAR